MATPTTLRPGEATTEAPANLYVGEMSSASTSPSMVEEEEGGMSSDESVHRVLGKDKSAHGKTLLKMKDKVLIRNKVHYEYNLQCVYMC